MYYNQHKLYKVGKYYCAFASHLYEGIDWNNYLYILRWKANFKTLSFWYEWKQYIQHNDHKLQENILNKLFLAVADFFLAKSFYFFGKVAEKTW